MDPENKKSNPSGIKLVRKGMSDISVRMSGISVRRIKNVPLKAHSKDGIASTKGKDKELQIPKPIPKPHPIEELWQDSTLEPLLNLPSNINSGMFPLNADSKIFSSIETSAKIAGKEKPKKQLNLLNRKHLVEAKLFALRKNKIKHQLVIFTTSVLVLALIFQSANIFAASMKNKSAVLGATTEALANLQEARDLASQKNFSGAEKQLEYAEQNFAQAKSNLSEIGGFFNSLVAASPQGQTAASLLNAGGLVANAGINLDNFYTLISQVKITAAGFNSPDGFYQTMTGAEKYLQNADDDLSQASALFSKVNPDALPAGYSQKYQSYTQQLQGAVSALQEVHDLISLFQNFLGPGQKNILVLFENNNELRATGGFIGTYGIFKFNNGKIENQTISSVYDLDGQLAEKIAPPGPFYNLTDHWGLRDSNWFVDFPTSAQKAISFYELEKQETPDAVIAVNPDLFIDILKITGPIYFPKYNLTLGADNFRSIIQFDTSVNYDKQQNTPKQILADFAPLLLQKIHDLNRSEYAQLFSVFLQNLSQKNLIFYDRNPDIEDGFQSYGWSGNIASTDRDYLAVFNSNLGGKKTDLSMRQNLKLQSEVQNDGSIVDTITYTRTHSTDLGDTDKNIDYVRFLVPAGSVLISASGFTKEHYYPSDGSAYTWDLQQPFSVDPDLRGMDNAAGIDQSSGTVITKEAGKTEFANWMEIDPGDSQTVVLKYKLPFNINQTRKYSLVLQKQPGNTPIDFSYDLKQDRKVLWYTPYDMNVAGSVISYATQLNADMLLGMVFDK